MARWPLGRRGGLLLALVVAAVGVAIVVVGFRAQVSAPRPHDAGRIDTGTSPSGTTSTDPSTSPSGSAPSSSAATPLGPSAPTRLRIPAIDVDTEVFPIGLAPDGTLAVPQPGPHLNDAAWFRNSPTPGQPGASIVEGHVDSVEGASVFLRLGAIKPGDKVIVTRSDGRTLTFEVNAVRDFLKSKFPTQLVYGGSSQELSQPTLRLITCSDYDASIHHHVGNEVVFTHLVHVSQAS